MRTVRFLAASVGLAALTAGPAMAAEERSECTLEKVSEPLVAVSWRSSADGEIESPESGLALSATNRDERPLTFQLALRGRADGQAAARQYSLGVVPAGATVSTRLSLADLGLNAAARRYAGRVAVELRAEGPDGRLAARAFTEPLYFHVDPVSARLAVYSERLHRTRYGAGDFRRTRPSPEMTLPERPGERVELGAVAGAARSLTPAELKDPMDTAPSATSRSKEEGR